MEMGSTDTRSKRYNTTKKDTHKYDKQLINVAGGVNNNQSDTVLFTCTYPCVVMGVIFHGGTNTLAALLQGFQWYIHIVEQGSNIPVIAYNGSSFQPEQNVMCFGSGMIGTSGNYFNVTKTKTGRKLRAGDRVIFSIGTNVAQIMNFMGIIQFFLKI